MDSKFTSKLHLDELIISKDPEIFVNVDIIIVDCNVTMIFEHENTEYDASEIFKIVLPYILKKYGATKEELNDTFKVISSNNFSFSFEHRKLKEYSSLIVELARNVLLKYSVKDNQIIEIKFLPEEYESGNGIIHAKIDIGYDEDTDGDYPIYKHRTFLEEKLQSEALVKAIIDLS